MNKFMEEWTEYAKMEGDNNSFSSGMQQTSQLEEHMSFQLSGDTAKAFRILLKYEEDIVELWFPKASVDISGKYLRVAEWFTPSFERNLEAALEEL